MHLFVFAGQKRIETMPFLSQNRLAATASQHHGSRKRSRRVTFKEMENAWKEIRKYLDDMIEIIRAFPEKDGMDEQVTLGCLARYRRRTASLEASAQRRWQEISVAFERVDHISRSPSPSFESDHVSASDSEDNNEDSDATLRVPKFRCRSSSSVEY